MILYFVCSHSNRICHKTLIHELFQAAGVETRVSSTLLWITSVLWPSLWSGTSQAQLWSCHFSFFFTFLFSFFSLFDCFFFWQKYTIKQSNSEPKRFEYIVPTVCCRTKTNPLDDFIGQKTPQSPSSTVWLVQWTTVTTEDYFIALMCKSIRWSQYTSNCG